MADEIEKSEEALNKVEQLRRHWKAASGGRAYYEGTMVLFEGKLGVIVHVHQGAEDPTASTVDVRLNDGKIIQAVSVDSKQLVRYRA